MRAMRTLAAGCALVVACAPAEPPDGSLPQVHDPGRVVLHRLNHDEYDRTVRDLLGTDQRPSATFPADVRSAGFDNIAQSQTLSTLHAEAYLDAAVSLAEEAVAGGALRSCDLLYHEAHVCVRDVLADLAGRAWRRPVTKEEVERFAAFATRLLEDHDYEDVLTYGVVAVLSSPSFLFRPEPLADPDDPASQALSDWAIASRLSYFLWSSMPDEALFDAAAQGRLRGAAGIEAQVRRMLRDPKADALVANFAGQWLYLRGVAGAVPDPDLGASMHEETARFFQTFVRSDRDVRELLTAGAGEVDGRLAVHYGIGAVADWEEVDLDPVGRGGVLGHGGLLSVLSHQHHTSPVRRGHFVLSQLLCEGPEGPPPGVEGLVLESATTSQRAQLEAHRADPACRGCHATMDELGFALEHFGPQGAWRQRDDWGAIDATARLPDGTTFYGAQALADWVAADPRFPACVARQLLTYALGRVPGAADEPTLRDLTRDFVSEGASFEALAVAIATSAPFRRARGEVP